MENSEKDLKDVACVVFQPNEARENDSIYLIDITRGKLRGFVHLNDKDFPIFMAYVVHKSILYMFGGHVGVGGDFDKFGTDDVYVLDLFELAKTTGQRNVEPKPLITKWAPMPTRKCGVNAVMVGEKICVFGQNLGCKPNGCHFEVFDPKERTWDKLPDPFELSPGSFVEGYFVKDEKLFVSICNAPGIYELNLGTTNTAAWCHHDVLYGVDCLPYNANGAQFGTLVFCSDRAFDIENTGFAKSIWLNYSRDIIDKRYEVRCSYNGQFFRFGHDKVCLISGSVLSKPSRKLHRKRKSAMLLLGMLANKKLHRTLLHVLSKCQRRKSSCRLVVNVCKVDVAARPIQLKVLQSFTVPMNFEFVVESGQITMASLCDP